MFIESTGLTWFETFVIISVCVIVVLVTALIAYHKFNCQNNRKEETNDHNKKTNTTKNDVSETTFTIEENDFLPFSPKSMSPQINIFDSPQNKKETQKSYHVKLPTNNDAGFQSPGRIPDIIVCQDMSL